MTGSETGSENLTGQPNRANPASYKIHIIRHNYKIPCFAIKVKGFSSASGLRIIPFRNYEVRGHLRIDVSGFMPFGTLRIGEKTRSLSNADE